MPENLRTLRHKREIVSEIRQITRAMKLVSAAKLKRALSWRSAAQAYYDEVHEALSVMISRVGEGFTHPLLEERPVETCGLLLVAGDKGLCGAFNASIIREARRFVAEADRRVRTITVGTRTAEMARRARLNVVREFAAIHERHGGGDVQEIVRYLTGAWSEGEIDQLQVCYARFISRISNEPVIEQALPATVPEATGAEELLIVEPDPEQVARQLVPQHVTARIFQALLSSAASEHSARLLAMTAATENAEEMIDDLTRSINRARQAEITSELLDVVGGADALEQRM